MTLFSMYRTWTFMKRLRSAVLLLSVISLACLFQSCEESLDYTMRMSPDEQAEAMVGTWVLTRAGMSPPSLDGTGEEHIENNVETGLKYVEITGSEITFNFEAPVPVYFQGKDTRSYPELHEETASFKLQHDVGSIPHLTAINVDGSGTFAFCYSEEEASGANQFSFYTKDDVHAIRMVLSFYIEGYYFEFERE